MEAPGLRDHVWLVPCLSLLSQHVPGSMLPSKLLEWTEPDEECCLCNAVKARSHMLFLQVSLPLVDPDSLLFLLKLPSHTPVFPCQWSSLQTALSSFPLFCSQTPSLHLFIHTSSSQIFWACIITSGMSGGLWMSTPFWTTKVDREEAS